VEWKWSTKHEAKTKDEPDVIGTPPLTLFEDCAKALQEDIVDPEPDCPAQSSDHAPSQSPEKSKQPLDPVGDEEMDEFFPYPTPVWNTQDAMADEGLFNDYLFAFDNALEQQDTTKTDIKWDFFDIIMPVELLATSEDDHSQSQIEPYEKSNTHLFDNVSNLNRLTRSLVDVSTLLVSNWFSSVCPMWSGFDSNINPNRLMVSSTWTHSKAVLYSIKSMSAICLLDTLPHLRSEVHTYTRLAASAIQQSLVDLSTNWFSSRVTIPLDLFMALLCMGTSMCWLNTTNLGLSYWKGARMLLNRYTDLNWLLDDGEREKLAFIERSCVYWDMLCSVVTNESLPLDSPIRSTISTCQRPSTIVQAHPWTGVAHDQQRVLSRTLSLCRRFQNRQQAKANLTVPGFDIGLDDYNEAHDVISIIHNLDVPLMENVTDTGDYLSPRTHFIELAKAYRIASLLQLYQTFPDLSVSLCSTKTTTSEPTSRTLFLLSLTFELLAILARIPASSNTRCTQPILYIIAASGLRFEEPPDNAGSCGLTECAFKVHQGRRFILDRFASFQQSLPSKPILVAVQLVKTIWKRSDQRGSDSFDVRWMNVMIETGLCTLFG
jgi:hypothetical protein